MGIDSSSPQTQPLDEATLQFCRYAEYINTYGRTNGGIEHLEVKNIRGPGGQSLLHVVMEKYLEGPMDEENLRFLNGVVAQLIDSDLDPLVMNSDGFNALCFFLKATDQNIIGVSQGIENLFNCIKEKYPDRYLDILIKLLEGEILENRYLKKTPYISCILDIVSRVCGDDFERFVIAALTSRGAYSYFDPNTRAFAEVIFAWLLSKPPGVCRQLLPNQDVIAKKISSLPYWEYTSSVVAPQLSPVLTDKPQTLEVLLIPFLLHYNFLKETILEFAMMPAPNTFYPTFVYCLLRYYNVFENEAQCLSEPFKKLFNKVGYFFSYPERCHILLRFVTFLEQARHERDASNLLMAEAAAPAQAAIFLTENMSAEEKIHSLPFLMLDRVIAEHSLLCYRNYTQKVLPSISALFHSTEISLATSPLILACQGVLSEMAQLPTEPSEELTPDALKFITLCTENEVPLPKLQG